VSKGDEKAFENKVKACRFLLSVMGILSRSYGICYTPSSSSFMSVSRLVIVVCASAAFCASFREAGFLCAAHRKVPPVSFPSRLIVHSHRDTSNLIEDPSKPGAFTRNYPLPHTNRFAVMAQSLTAHWYQMSCLGFGPSSPGTQGRLRGVQDRVRLHQGTITAQVALGCVVARFGVLSPANSHTTVYGL
jgi:hypothetical protein